MNIAPISKVCLNGALLSEPMLKITQVSPDNGKHHWFGYYDVCPWSADENSILCMESNFMHRVPTHKDQIRLLLIDSHSKQYECIGTSNSWNWQMGCRLQWIPGKANSHIFYNDLRDNTFTGVIKDIETDKEKVLPCPVYAVSRSGLYGATLNFSRLHDCRPGYGYSGLKDEYEDVHTPENDGLFLVNMSNGQKEIMISYAEMSEQLGITDNNHKKWINHLFWGPGDKNIIFFLRYRLNDGNCVSHLICFDVLDKKITELGRGAVSHFDWQDKKNILIYATFEDYPEANYYWVEVPSGEKRLFWKHKGISDGHCSHSPDMTKIVSDTYPSGENNSYSVFVYSLESQKIDTVATLTHPLGLPVDCRCDLHPRWSRNQNHICFDGVKNSYRQLFVIDLKV